MHVVCRFAIKRREKHDGIERFCSQATHAVDKFHFLKNHVGIWCDVMTNPYRLPALRSGNTEVCEQRFKHLNKYSSMLRHMKKERFTWTLLTITEVDHRFRRQGLLGPRV